MLAREDHISLHWYEYGVFQLLNFDCDKAEQCFKESISLDQKFVPAYVKNSLPNNHYMIIYYLSYSLLLYGICCTISNKHEEAEEILEFATTIDECNTIAWTIRGV